MRRIIVVQVIGFALFVMYTALLIVSLITDSLGEWDVLVISVMLAIVSMNLIYKGVLIRSQATLWFAITLLLYALTIIISELRQIALGEHYYIYSLVPVISSIINLAIFENLIYIKVVILNITIIIPVLVQYFLQPNIWLVVIVSIVSVVSGLIICRFIGLKKEKT